MILPQLYNPNERDGLKYTHRLRNYYPSTKKLRCLLLSSVLIIHQAVNAQNNSGYKIFERTPLGQLHITIPQPATFQPVSITPVFPSSKTNPIPGGLPGNNFLSSDVEQQNQRVMQMHNALANGGGHGSLPPDIQQDMAELEQEARYNEWMARTQYYRQAYYNLLHLNPDSFSITKAVYLVENAWYENKYSFGNLQERMKAEAKIIKQILKAEKLDAKNDMALNYAIQKRFRHGGSFYDAKTKKMLTAPAFKYDFEDYMGKEDYRQMFVTKMLVSGKGQCHSMPLAYLMIAEQVGAKAWLSLAPEHSFIRFADARGSLVNFETTNANLVSNNWLTQSSYITAQALQNRIYLDTLSQRNLYAQMLGDLLLGYLKKFNYDGFAQQIQQRILQINPENLTALIVDANIKMQIAAAEIKRAGNPPEEKLPQYPAAYRAYLAMQEAYAHVDDLGYQTMPPEAYQAWLKSFEAAKEKQENKELKEKLQKEIKQLKNLPKPKVIYNKND